jgi:carbonic anhydrase
MSPSPTPWSAGLIIGEVSASLVVFLVAVPLSLGIAVASGAPVQAGLIAAVVGGVVVGLFGGAPLQVSGPAAGLTVMVFGFVQQFGFSAVGVIVVIAGLVQLVAGLLRIARVALAIAPAVLHAMLAGIGVLIALGQFLVVLGGKPRGSALANLQALPDAVAHLNPWTLLIGVVTFASLQIWNRAVAARVKVIPGSLVAVLIGTVLSLVVPGTVDRVSLGSGSLAGFSWPSIGGADVGGIVLSALALAVVASAESLLCAVATDQLHAGPRANLDRELVAQGLGNITSGLLGGLPVTGVIVRSSANIAAGARTRWSAVLHGVWIALFVLLASDILVRLPMAALAALLISVGINLVKVKEFKKIAAFNEAFVYLATFGGVVFLNLLWGIGIGLVLGLLLLLRRLTVVELVRCPADSGDTLIVTVRGNLSFLAVPTLSRELSMLPLGQSIELRFDVKAIDHAAVETIRAWRIGYERSGGRVIKEPLDRVWQSVRSGSAA